MSTGLGHGAKLVFLNCHIFVNGMKTCFKNERVLFFFQLLVITICGSCCIGRCVCVCVCRWMWKGCRWMVLPLSEPCLIDAVSFCAQRHKFPLLFRFGAVEEARPELWWCRSSRLQHWHIRGAKSQISKQVWWTFSGMSAVWIVYLQWTTVGADAPSVCMCCLTSPLNWIRTCVLSGTPWSGQAVKWNCFTLYSSEVCLCEHTLNQTLPFFSFFKFMSLGVNFLHVLLSVFSESSWTSPARILWWPAALRTDKACSLQASIFHI